MNHQLTRALALAVSVVAIGAAQPSAAPASTPRANEIDRAFVREMVPHHHMAVEMAKMAKVDGNHAKIRRLANRIIKAQNREIAQLTRIAGRLGVTPETMPVNGDMSEQMMKDLETLGVSMDSSGMMMDMSELDGAKPFDRAFIDMMIPHHQGAILMARAERKGGTNQQLRRIAKAIIRDQAKEIREMNAWRKVWYGAKSPAGGVPRA